MRKMLRNKRELFPKCKALSATARITYSYPLAEPFLSLYSKFALVALLKIYFEVVIAIGPGSSFFLPLRTAKVIDHCN